ncbi:MAG: hypothetical protein A2017_04725 [Lentisphaerae bacterium GWF2_44_16]|nr:MAG: hypothetical protein A2017_04725 [Lentisphaerae bacterium GWF2_44_16]
MINRIKKKIRNLFGLFGPLTEKSPSVLSAKAHDAVASSHKRKDKQDIRSGEKKTKYRPNDKTRKAMHRQTSPQAPKKIPALKEVPLEEGKMRFSELDISTEVLCGIQELEFKYCTAIQQKCLPYSLAGRDVTGKAQTGTGKTAAFLITAFTKMLRNPLTGRKPGTCRTLIMAPTRELAIQIHKDAEELGRFCGFNNLVVFGGMGHKEQRDRLSKPIDILVGTPGRIIDYSRSGNLRLSETEILVIDEADRMLDMGFIPDVKRIVSQLPPTGQRQTMFFSATLTSDILRLVKTWLQDPVTVEIEPERAVADLISQKFYAVAEKEKFSLLLWILQHSEVKRMLIFGNRKDKNQRLANRLLRYRINCEILSGDIPQNRRMKILEKFRTGEIPVIVASDVAARGIHVESISHVVNYDIPDKAEDYIHRVGRTGRAGEAGISISFVCEYGAYILPDVEKLLGYQIECAHPDENMLHLPPPLEAEKIPRQHHRTESGRRGHYESRGRRPQRRN